MTFAQLGIEHLRIESRLLPTLTYDFRNTEPGGITKAAKPSIKARVQGRDLTLYEPYGPPNFSYLPYFAGGFAAIFLGLGYLLGR